MSLTYNIRFFELMYLNQFYKNIVGITNGTFTKYEHNRGFLIHTTV